ncbi:RCC1 domain-containing protein 1-like [Haliotis rubra]|uniref:RCC1 domain-containing protein 1-like n=1 Tax=Haliotis rubra TaxID=36100 RepID=UPI001EE5E1FA|nr:RCC1 domain-containing protein 1-like [Haliotis rubra]
MDIYACGFNGFQQISLLHERDVQNESTQINVQPYFDSPVKLHVTTDCLSSCLITWSKLRFRCNSESTPTEDSCCPVAASWNRTVYRTAAGQYLVGGGTDVPNPMRVDVDSRVDDVVGGEDRLYCIHDGGRLSEIVDGGTGSADDNPREASDGKVAFLRQVFTLSPVTSLSCGKEHVVFLTKHGHVYSFGLGSRGQLGHDSVEEETEPRMVDSLDGLRVVGVAAGGWHSAAITASGDLFTWGWNESGQLGHSTGQVLGADATTLHDVSIGRTAGDTPNHAQICPNKTSDPESVQVKDADQNIRQLSQTVIVKQSHDFSLNFEDKCSNPTQRLPVCSDPLNKEISSLGASKQLAEPQNSIVMDEVELNSGCGDGATVGQGTNADEDQGKLVEQDPGKVVDEDQGKLVEDDPGKVVEEDPGKIVETDKGKFVDELQEKFVDQARLSLISSPLLVTSLPDDYTAVKVSCGSRHTAVVTDDGVLYTSGWNKYGQLGHGHTRSSDVFKLVSLTSVKVIDVKCGCWNTVILSENETSSVA